LRKKDARPKEIPEAGNGNRLINVSPFYCALHGFKGLAQNRSGFVRLALPANKNSRVTIRLTARAILHMVQYLLLSHHSSKNFSSRISACEGLE